MRKCRFCAKDIQDTSRVCEHCGRELLPPVATPAPAPPVPAPSPQAQAVADYQAVARRRPGGFWRVLQTLCWFGAAFGAVVGGVLAFGGIVTATGAPQQAAAASMGCVIAIVPYVFARAVSEMFAER
jgi:DNA-binding transcriptional LysR family regulator